MSALPWLAGWFEARGCIIINCYESKHAKTGRKIRRDQFLVAICVPDKVGAFLVSTFGGGLRSHSRRLKYGESTREWRAYSDEAAAFLKALEPHVKLRRPEFEAAFLFWKTMHTRKRGFKVAPEVIRARIVAYDAFRAARIRRANYAQSRRYSKELRKASGEA